MVRKQPFQKTLLLYVLLYMQQFGAETILVENVIFVIAFRTIFEQSGGAIAPASPMAAQCLMHPGKAGSLYRLQQLPHKAIRSRSNCKNAIASNFPHLISISHFYQTSYFYYYYIILSLPCINFL